MKPNPAWSSPPWGSVKTGPMLRRDRALRRYGRMPRPHTDQVQGVRKLAILATLWPFRKATRRQPQGTDPPRGRLAVIKTQDFTLIGLDRHREMIRGQLLDVTNRAIVPQWGGGDYVAVHNRLGDFRAPELKLLEARMVNNIRLSLAWY
jgi:hypothetical protein